MSQPTPDSEACGDDGQADTAPLHLRLAEQGKVHAVAGEHDTALLYYRHAMRQAVESRAPEAFFRHYLECSIESLELLGHHQEVLDYCQRVEDHYARITAADEHQAAFIARDLMANAQRAGLVLAKLDRRAEARASLADASLRAKDLGVELPLAARVGDWLDRGLQLAPDRLVAEQKRLCYFAVTRDSLKPGLALELPPNMLTNPKS